MDVCMLRLPCALLLSALLLVIVSCSQKCVPQLLPDMVINISQAVAHGARFTDPLRVSSAEECLSACCMQRDRGGDCNLLVFDARKGPGLQNCYIFHCPTMTSCPLSPQVGVLSYSFWSEPSHPRKPDTKFSDGGKTPVSAVSDRDHKRPGAVVASQVSAKHYTKEEPADAPKSIASELLHLADKIDRHLEEMESKSEDDLQRHRPSPTTAIAPNTVPAHKEAKKVPADAKAVKPGRDKKLEVPKTYFPAEVTRQAGTTSTIGTAAPQPVTRKKAVPTLPPQDVSGAKKVPGSAKASPKKVDDPSPPHTQGPELTGAHQPPKRVTHPAPVRTSPREGADERSTGDQGETPGRALPETRPSQEPAVDLEEAPRDAPPTREDKSGLVAALVFGVLFVTVVIGLVSRKVSEARRRHRYTKLDYLINGMYVDT